MIVELMMREHAGTVRERTVREGIIRTREMDRNTSANACIFNPTNLDSFILSITVRNIPNGICETA